MPSQDPPRPSLPWFGIPLVVSLGCRPPLLDGSSGVKCTERPSEELALTSRLAPIATVAQVSWQTSTAGSSSVYFQPEGGPLYQTSVQEGEAGAYEADLIGSPEHTVVQWQVVGTDGEETWCSPMMELTTGGHSVALPEFKVETLDADALDGGFVAATLLTSETPLVVLLDRDGQVVWAVEVRLGAVFRAAASLDHKAMVVNPQPGLSQPGQLARYDLATGDVVSTDFGAAHTDFVEVEDGVFYTLAWDVREVEGEGRLSGDSLLRVEADGTMEEVWNSWDHLTIDLGEAMSGGHPFGDDIRDWTHLNGVSYNADEDSVLMTSGARSSVISVDASTGETNWVLGGPQGEFAARSLIAAPHSAKLLSSDEVLVFNRGMTEDACSTADWIKLYPDQGAADIDWSYASEDCVKVYFLGEAARAASGNTFVDFATAGRIDQVDESGQLVQRIGLDLGAATGFITPTPSLY